MKIFYFFRKNLVKYLFLLICRVLVKMIVAEKIETCRTLPLCVMLTHKETHPNFLPVFPVENTCWKVCGQCGKVKVINRYSVCFPLLPAFIISTFRQFLTRAPRLSQMCYVTGVMAPEFENFDEKVETFGKIHAFRLPIFHSLSENLYKFPKSSKGIFFPGMEKIEELPYSGGWPCREK